MKHGKMSWRPWQKLNVHYISTRTIGYNHIDIEQAEKLGIHVCNASYAPNGVADFTIMMMLMCLRQYKQALWRGQVNDFSLSGLMGREMKDLTVGGYGNRPDRSSGDPGAFRLRLQDPGL